MLGSQIIFGLYGRTKKKSEEITCPADFKPSVTVVIPSKNESKRLPYALASLVRQTYKVDKIIVIDDGSTDNTFEVATLMKNLTDLDIFIMRNDISIGKTPSIKNALNECTTDKVFVFDADTILEDNYIEKLVVPHFKNNVACSYGIVKPLFEDFKKNFYKTVIKSLLSKSSTIRDSKAPFSEKFYNRIFVDKYYHKIISDNEEDNSLTIQNILRFRNVRYYLYEWTVTKYREGVYADQYFTREAQKRMFNTTLFPVGCGVLYDRIKLKGVFQKYGQTLGVNLTTSEDIFIGFEFCDQGLINYQVTDAHMWTTEPNIKRLPFQLVLWGSSFIQSAYYFQTLSKRVKGTKYERPIGLAILPPIIEKVSYPLALSAISLVAYEWTLATIGIEFLLFFGISYLSTPKKERKGLASSLVVAEPIRLISVPVDIFILCKFGVDMLIGNRKWKK